MSFDSILCCKFLNFSSPNRELEKAKVIDNLISIMFRVIIIVLVVFFFCALFFSICALFSS